ncbi:MAG: hypothetical protein R2847_09170 [Bacteroidia bacterium]
MYFSVQVTIGTCFVVMTCTIIGAQRRLIVNIRLLFSVKVKLIIALADVIAVSRIKIKLSVTVIQ